MGQLEVSIMVNGKNKKFQRKIILVSYLQLILLQFTKRTGPDK